jgi:carbon storage regulator CsrA
MLSLTRRVGEALVIAPGTPQEIVVEVVRVRGQQVRLAFEGDAQVVRKELMEEQRHG